MVCSDCAPLARLAEKLRKRVEELERRDAEREKKLLELEARLAAYENPDTPPSMKRFPQRKTRDDESSGKPGRPPGYEGSTRPTPEPDKIKVVHASECPQCGSSLGEPAGYQSIVVEEIPEPQPVQVTEFKLAQYVCPHCGQGVSASHPDCPKQGVFGFRAMSQVALLKYHGRLPCKLVCRALERDYGLTVTAATVLAVNGRVANALEPEYEAVKQRVRAAFAVHVDESGLRVGGCGYWIWIFVTDGETLVVIRQSRGKKVLREVLGDEFNGIIVCDGHKAYSNFTGNIQRCWAHLLRHAKQAAEEVGEAKLLHKALKRLYRRLTTALQGNPPARKRERLKRNALQALRRLLAKPWREKQTLKVAEYLRNGMRHWLTFVVTPGVEPTNNRAERALREHVVIRKIIGTLRNEEGTHSHEVITSVLATWRQRKPTSESQLRERLTQAIRGS